jgi:hypothetical protein
MNSPNRFDFNENNLPVTLDGSFPLPDSPLISESMIAPGSPVAAPDSPVAAAAAEAPSYYLDGPERPSPSREELERFHRELDRSRRINRQLFFSRAENEDKEDPEVAMLENHFGIIETAAAAAKYGAGWISAIKQDYGYEPLQYGLVPRRGAAATNRKNTLGKRKRKGGDKKRQGKRGGGKKKYKKKRTKKKSRRRKRKTLKKKRKRRRKTRR